jgi:gliding motility-associated-like protein
VNIINGLGNYVYQLQYPDGSLSEVQTSNQFTNLASGTYFVNIFDTLGECSPTRIGPIYIVNYPKFFTPNGDNFNDFWNIWDLSNQTDADISIFDRYGKLITQLSPAIGGWDGKLNGQDLPSTDYWFSVEYYPQNSTEKQLFRAHFSLIR